MANRVVLRSRFKEAGRHARKQTERAVEKAVEAGEREANIRIEKANAQRGWNISTDVESEASGMSGKIEFPHFWGRFFEYGSVKHDAMPFMRPGHRKMRKVFKQEMGELFSGFRGTGRGRR